MRATMTSFWEADMRVLICGGRQFEDAGFMWQTMDTLRAETPGGIAEVIAGGAVLDGRVMGIV